jgi:serine/threonine protein kinase
MNYEILDIIGEGQSGIVYRAMDLKNKREVALKKIPNRASQEIGSYLLMENIDYIPKLYDHFYETDSLGHENTYIVQQLIHGTELGVTWDENRNWDFMWMTLYHALAAIKTLHDHGYYHGDLHANNFLWTGETVYIIDFEKSGSITDNHIECEDYLALLDPPFFNKRYQHRYLRYDNINHGRERYKLLTEFATLTQCETFIGDLSYIDRILQEYDAIDRIVY